MKHILPSKHIRITTQRIILSLALKTRNAKFAKEQPETISTRYNEVISNLIYSECDTMKRQKLFYQNKTYRENTKSFVDTFKRRTLKFTKHQGKRLMN